MTRNDLQQQLIGIVAYAIYRERCREILNKEQKASMMAEAQMAYVGFERTPDEVRTVHFNLFKAKVDETVAQIMAMIYELPLKEGAIDDTDTGTDDGAGCA